MAIIPANWKTVYRLHRTIQDRRILSKPSHTAPKCVACNNPHAKQSKVTVPGMPGKWICSSCDWTYAEIESTEND